MQEGIDKGREIGRYNISTYFSRYLFKNWSCINIVKVMTMWYGQFFCFFFPFVEVTISSISTLIIYIVLVTNCFFLVNVDGPGVVMVVVRSICV